MSSLSLARSDSPSDVEGDEDFGETAGANELHFAAYKVQEKEGREQRQRGESDIESNVEGAVEGDVESESENKIEIWGREGERDAFRGFLGPLFNVQCACLPCF